MKKFVSVLTALIILAVFLCPTLVFAAKNPPAFRVSSAKAARNEEVDITVAIENNPGITSAKLKIAFDKVLTLKDVRFGEKLGGNVQRSQDLSSPLTLNWFSGFKDLKSDVVFATLVFAADSAAEKGDYKISVTYNKNDVFNLAEENIEFKTIDGKITVTGDSGAVLTGESAAAPATAVTKAAASSAVSETVATPTIAAAKATASSDASEAVAAPEAGVAEESASSAENVNDAATKEILSAIEQGTSSAVDSGETVGANEESGNYVGEEVLFDDDGNVIEDEDSAEAQTGTETVGENGNEGTTKIWTGTVDAPEENGEENNALLWIGVAAAVLIIAAAVLLYLNTNKGKKKADTEE